VRGPGVIMLNALVVGLAQFFDVAARLSSGELFEQARVRIRLDVQDILPAVTGDLSQVRCVGVKRVLDQQDVQRRMILLKPRAKPFGGVALAVVLLLAVLFEYRLQRSSASSMRCCYAPCRSLRQNALCESGGSSVGVIAPRLLRRIS